MSNIIVICDTIFGERERDREAERQRETERQREREMAGSLKMF